MHYLRTALQVTAVLIQLSYHVDCSLNNSSVVDAFGQLYGLQQSPNSSKLSLALGGQDFDHCCLLAMNYSLDVASDGSLIKSENSFIDGPIDDFSNNAKRQFPCFAKYDHNNDAGSPSLNIPYSW